MNQDDIDALNGQVLALSLTLSAVIQTLPALAGAEAALRLKISQEEALLDDAETPPTEARARNSVLSSYVDLLSSVGEHGR